MIKVSLSSLVVFSVLTASFSKTAAAQDSRSKADPSKAASVPNAFVPVPGRGQGVIGSVTSSTIDTQAVLAYTAPSSSACTVAVSESSAYSPLVNDANPALFSGADRDDRTGALTNGGNRVFVIGKRAVETALDRRNYSRALQANTTHYYRVTCGASVATGTFRTSNVPLGNTFNEVPQIDRATGAAMVPDWPGDRSTPVIDPQTGVLFKRFWLPADNTTKGPYLNDAGGTHMCGYQLVGPGPGYMCAFPAGDGGAGMVYYVIPSTGEVRFLGDLWISSGPDYPAGGSTPIGFPRIDPANALVIYVVVYNNSGHPVLLKATYSGDFSNRVAAPGSNVVAPYIYVNLTPEPHTLSALVADFDPGFDPTKFSCNLQSEGQYGLITCLRGNQDSYGWLAAMDMGNRQPVGSCGSDPNLCPHIVAAVNMMTNPKSRWCGIHSGAVTSNVPISMTVPHGLIGSAPTVGVGPYGTTLAAGINASATSITVSSEPLSASVSEPYVMDAQVGDHFVIGSERIMITAKNGNNWTVQRAFVNSDIWPAQAYAAGTFLYADCQNWSTIWWKFLQSPRGTGDGYFNDNYIFGGHEDVEPNGRVMEAYVGKMGSPYDIANTPAAFEMNTDPLFAGARGWSDGNSYSHYPVYQQTNAPAAEQQWFLDEPTFGGGTQFGPGLTLIPGTGQLYKYSFGDWGGLNRKQLPTIASTHGKGLSDISGPGSVMAGDASGSYTYCVAYVANECVAGSTPNDAYVNAPNITQPYCAGSEFPNPNQADACLANAATFGQAAIQFGFQANAVGLQVGQTSPRFVGAGYSRKLSGGFGGIKGLGLLFKPLPSGDWAWISVGGAGLVMMKVPPFPALDGVDRSTFVPAPISIAAPAGLGIATAAIEFGYAEFGTPSQHYCTSRGEACVAVASTVTNASPFQYATTDSYSRMPCAGSCSITLPVLPMHTAYWQVKFYNASGVLVQPGAQGVVAEGTVVALH